MGDGGGNIENEETTGYFHPSLSYDNWTICLLR